MLDYQNYCVSLLGANTGYKALGFVNFTSNV